MKQRWYPKKPIGLLALLTALALTAIFLTGSQASARQARSLDQPQGIDSQDDGSLEVAVEWINDFPGTADDRSHWDESCDGLYYGLLDKGWTGRFRWTDWNAWETDFKDESQGGSEDTWIDSADIGMLCTHGSGAHDDFWSQDLSSVYFGSSHTDQDLSPGDAYLAYGDKDLEWLAFDSCSVLSDGGPAPYYNRGYWAASMGNLRLLLGFNNTMYVWAPGDGEYWSYFMNGFEFLGFQILPPFSVMQSWFMAADYNQPTVTCARVLANSYDNFNDYLHGKGYLSAEPTPDGTYWYWDHCSAGLQIDEVVEELAAPQQLIALPRVRVLPRMVDESFIMDRIAPAFDMTGTINSDDMFFIMMDNAGGVTRTLLVDKATGGFNFKNLSRLWVTPEFTPTLPLYLEALDISSNFFASQGEGLPGVWWNLGTQQRVRYSVETLTEGMVAGEQIPDRVLAEEPADVYLNYGRSIELPVQTANGTQLATYPVVGPGSELKVYLGDGGEVIGVQGGTRDVEVLTQTVEIMEPTDAWNLYMGDQRIALPQVPYPADVITYTFSTLGFYELPHPTPQVELIPVWIFLADFYKGGNLLASNVQVNIPAALEFFAPQVTILEPAEGVVVPSGQTLHFAGDVLQYGTPPFTFEWYSDSDGFLGSGAEIDADLSSSQKEGEVFTHIITLKVTDANSMIGVASVNVLVSPAIYLPFIHR